MSDLREAQEFFARMQPMHDQIVDGLRRLGWSRDDAVFEADEKLSRWFNAEKTSNSEPDSSNSERETQ